MSMQVSVSKSLFSYWNALRANRPAPKRFEIDPSHIAANLPDTFILEQIDRGTLRFRLAGTRITELLGMDLRGKDLLDLFTLDDARTLRHQMDLVVTHSAVSVFHVSAENAVGQTTMLEILVLPLTHTRDCVDRFLGSIACVDRPGWIGTSPITRRTLVDHEIIWPDVLATHDKERSGRDTPALLPLRRDARIVRSQRRQFRVYDGGLVSTEER